MTAMIDIPIVLLTGFLGSGKTTLLNAVLRYPGFGGTVVLVNEFGQIGIDSDLLPSPEAGLILASNGCICCEAAADLGASLDDVVARLAVGLIPLPRRLIIETTGLADPVPLVHKLLQISGGTYYDGPETGPVRFRLERVIATVDVVTGPVSLDAHLECLKQAALADTLVLTKTDLAADPASRRDADALRDGLAALNPAARIVDRNAPGFQIGVLFSGYPYASAMLGGDAKAWLAAEAFSARRSHAENSEASTDSGIGIRSRCFQWDEPVSRAALQAFLDRLCFRFGVKLLRLKGILALDDDPERPAVVHGVRWTASPIERLDRWPEGERISRLVMITDGVPRTALEPLVADLRKGVVPSRSDALSAALAGVLVFLIAAAAICLALYGLGADRLLADFH
jgi:G3E family GTPase